MVLQLSERGISVSEPIDTYNQQVECSHQRTQRRIIPETYFGRTFEAEVTVCQDCQTKLWTNETRQKFFSWVMELKHQRRDTFRVQFFLPVIARTQLRDFLVRYPGVSMATLLRTLTATYLIALARVDGFQDLLKKLEARASYQALQVGKRQKAKIQFSPTALLDLQGWAGVLAIAPNELVEEAVLKLVAIQNESEGEFKDLWEKNLQPQMELILRAL